MTRPTPETLAVIEGLAREATPGPWFDDAAISGDGSVVMAEYTGSRVAHLPKAARPHRENAAFIAACDPQAVFGLIEALREAQNKAEDTGIRLRVALSELDALKKQLRPLTRVR